MDAIRVGQQVLLEQGSKAAAAMEIFKILKDESRDVVLQAFIEGANITPKGSPTYFYNVTRKLRKQKVWVWDKTDLQGWVETPTPTVNQIDGWVLESPLSTPEI